MRKRSPEERVVAGLRSVRFGRSAIGLAHMLDLPLQDVQAVLERLVALQRVKTFVCSRVLLYRIDP